MRLISLSAALIAATAIAGCTDNEDRIAFDGQYYRTKLSKVDGQRDVFTVSVRPVSASLEGAREAGRYEATVYCVNAYGDSDIVWAVGPDTPAEALTVVDDTLTFQGRCPQAQD